MGFLVEWNLTKFLSNQSLIFYFLVGGIVGSLIYGFKPRVEKFFGKYELKVSSTKKIITETSADKRKDLQEYSEHLKCDFLSLIESEMKENSIDSYYNAIKKLKSNKKMFLQHLYTFEKGGIISPPIYTRYQEARKVDGKLEQSSMTLSRLNSGFYSTAIKELKSSGFWTIDTNILLEQLGIPKIDYFDKNVNLDNINPKQPSEINKDSFTYEKDPKSFHVESYQIKYDGCIVAKAESKKIAKKLTQLLYKQCVFSTKQAISLLKVNTNNEKYIKPAVHNMFNDIVESLKSGKPNLGICDACEGFFPFERKINYKRHLLEFNSTPWSWSDELWD